MKTQGAVGFVSGANRGLGWPLPKSASGAALRRFTLECAIRMGPVSPESNRSALINRSGFDHGGRTQCPRVTFVTMSAP